MTFNHITRKEGDPIISAEWNSMGHEIERLETAKVDRLGDSIEGELKVTDLQVTGKLTVQGDVIAKDTQHIDGDVKLGNDDNDIVSVFGELKSGHSSGALQVKDSLRVSENLFVDGNIVGRLEINDTRDKNEPPVSYDREVSFDFKNRSSIGVPGTGTYSGMLTIAPWGDDTGNSHHQLNFNDGGIFWRQGLPNNDTWGDWHSIAYQGMTDDFSFAGNVGIGTNSPTAKLDVNGDLNVIGKVIANQGIEGKFKIFVGSTIPGNTNWQQYTGGCGIYLDIDTSEAGFSSVPMYFTSICGPTNHWSTTGATSIYSPHSKGFRIYVRRSNSGKLSPSQANGYGWYINWLGIELKK